MKKVLLTGFGPFLKNETNPTEDIVMQLDGQTIGDFHVLGKVLPVAFRESSTLVKRYIEELEPDAIILLGLASGRNKVTPERIAINCEDGKQSDNKGHIPKGEKIAANGPDGIFSTLPIGQMIEALQQAEIPAAISDTAGTYVCNHVMYETLYYLQATGKAKIPAGFIHLPANHSLALKHSIPSMAQTDLVRALEICVESLKKD